MKNQLPASQPACLPVPRPAGKGRTTRLLLLLLLGLGLLTAPARAQSHAWTKKTTNTAGKTAVAADQHGNSYVLTAFTGTATVGSYTFDSFGQGDVLLTKYNASGAVQWARRIGGTGNELAGDVDMVLEGNALFITGSFQSTIKFGTYHVLPVSPLTSAGQSDVFMARYNLAGALEWAQRAGGTGDDYGYGIDVTNDEDLYLTGSFTGTMQFKTPLSTLSLTSSGQSDLFLLKYDGAGTFQLVRKLGSAGIDYGMAVAYDRNTGNVYLTGGFSPPANTSVTNVLVARFSGEGALHWQKHYGSTAHLDTGNDIVVEPDGAYVTGYFGGTMNFDGKFLTCNGTADAFVAHFPRANMDYVAWARQFGGNNWDEGHSIAYRFGKLYLGGTFKGSATFGTTTFNAKGGGADRDLFLAGLSANGTPVWARQMGSADTDYGRGGMALYYGKSIFFTGHYGDAITVGNTSLTGPGNLHTRINLPAINDFALIHAGTDAVIDTMFNSVAINYLIIGTDKINFRANVVPGSVGSVKFVFDGVARTENASPFTWAGDQPKPGGTDYQGFTPAPGVHKLKATPYGGPNGTGAEGEPVFLSVTISNKPQLKDLTLIHAPNDTDIASLLAMTTITYAYIGTDKINLRATTYPAAVGSVQFVLDGVAKVENAAPYTLAGDALRPDGSIDYKEVTLAPGPHTLKVTAYSGPNATGTPSNTIEKLFHISVSGRRVSADPSGLEAGFAALQAAPNPFAGHTTLSFTAAEDGPATLEVYNGQGVPVARLYEGTLEKGKAYHWHFDGTAQPAGLYVARLKAGHKVLHQRLVLNK